MMKNKVHVYQQNGREFYHDLEKNYWIYQVPNIVAILPILPSGNVLLIEQYRAPVDMRLLELVTGGINPNEDPAYAAKREVLEETGWSTNDVSLIGTYYSMPGYATQKVFVYLAYLDSLDVSALEEHEIEFGLIAKEFSPEDAKIYSDQHTTHPYLKLAIDHHLKQI